MLCSGCSAIYGGNPNQKKQEFYETQHDLNNQSTKGNILVKSMKFSSLCLVNWVCNLSKYKGGLKIMWIESIQEKKHNQPRLVNIRKLWSLTGIFICQKFHIVYTDPLINLLTYFLLFSHFPEKAHDSKEFSKWKFKT